MVSCQLSGRLTAEGERFRRALMRSLVRAERPELILDARKCELRHSGTGRSQPVRPRWAPSTVPETGLEPASLPTAGFKPTVSTRFHHSGSYAATLSVLGFEWIPQLFGTTPLTWVDDEVSASRHKVDLARGSLAGLRGVLHKVQAAAIEGSSFLLSLLGFRVVGLAVFGGDEEVLFAFVALGLSGRGACGPWQRRRGQRDPLFGPRLSGRPGPGLTAQTLVAPGGRRFF